MTDTLSKAQRSWNMSRVASKDTKPELIIRTLLHRAGYRFKINDKTLPGRPDIVLPKHQTVIFIHGCFWHRHKNCKLASTPKSNQAFWQQKFLNNQRKDTRARRQLNALGWSVMTVWECRVMKDPAAVLKRIINRIGQTAGPYSGQQERRDILQAAEKKWRYLRG